MNAHRPRRPLSALRELLVRPLVRLGGKPQRRCKSAKLCLEPLEDRNLLAVSIAGTILSAVDGAPVPAATVFLDANGNGQLDQQFAYSQQGPTSVAKVTDGSAFNSLVMTSPLVVSGLAAAYSGVTLDLDVKNTTGGTLNIDLISPLGYPKGQGPLVLTLANNASFKGTLDETAATAVPSTVSGSFTTSPVRPKSQFSDAFQLVDNGAGNPDGSWRILFEVTSTTGITLNSWALHFKGSELSTQTDASGNYTFNDVLAGNYNVTAQNTTKGANPSLAVTVPSSGAATGQNLSIQPNADVVGTAFQVNGSATTTWGDTVTVNYTIANRGQAAAAAFATAVRLTPTGVLSPASASQPVLTTINVPTIAAGGSFSGSTQVTLPDAATAHALGFATPADAFLNLQLDPAGALDETSAVNNFNQGQGLDLAPVVATSNQAVSTDSGVQQNPSVTVDPTDPTGNHVAVAYMDYSATTVGGDNYAGIRVAESKDGGHSWTLSTVPLPAEFNTPGGLLAAGYPVAQFDASGKLFVAFMAAQFSSPNLPPVIFPADNNTVTFRSFGMQANNGIFVASATQGASGLQWSTPVAVAENLYSGTKVPFDTMPDLAIDQNGGTESLYVTWTRFYPAGLLPNPALPNPVGGSDIFVAVSTNGGASFTTRTQAVAASVENPSGTQVSVLRENAAASISLSSSSTVVMSQRTAATKLVVTNPKVTGTGSLVESLSGTPATSQVWAITLVAGGVTKTASVTVASGDTLSSVATKLTTAINALSSSGYSASLSGTDITISHTGSFTAQLAVTIISSTQTTFNISQGITPSAGQVWSLTITNPASDSIAVPAYTVASGDTLATVAAALVKNIGSLDAPGGTLPSAGDQQFAHVTVDAGHAVVVSYFLTAGTRFRVRRSTNAGVSFTLPSVSTSSSTVDPFFGTPIIPSFNDTNPAGPNYSPELRNIPVRDIVADPTRANVLYAVEAVETTAATGGAVIDPGEIDFARSDNNGATWQRYSIVAGNIGNIDDPSTTDLLRYRTALNDDDASSYLRQTTGSALSSQIIALQAMPRMFVDQKGDVVVIWYDTRRSPGNNLLDVYGTVSTDGGLTFSPNFRLTNVSFDPTKGAFTDPTGQQSFFLGDFLGVATANDGTAYAAWTDTRNGNQDVFVTRFAYLAPSAALNDRFEPNNTAATAADLGNIAGQATFASLVAAPGDVDYYKVTPAATGTFLVTVNASQPVTLELFDASGNVRLATGAALTDGSGNLIGQQLLIQGVTAGTPLLVKVSGVAANAPAVPYSLSLQALTLDFHTTVTGGNDANLAAGGTDLYAFTAPITGSVDVTLTGKTGLTGAVNFTILNSNGTQTLATGAPSGGATAGNSETANAAIVAGQVYLIRITGATGSSTGGYSLLFSVRDQYQSPSASSLLFPVAGAAPVALAAGDLDGANGPDLVAVNTDLANPVSVLLNAGGGLFGAPQTYDAGTGSSSLPGGNTRSVVLDDFNNKTGPDIALTNFASADVSVLTDNGDGTYGSDHRSDAVAYDGTLAAADFNGDGKRDLVVFPAATVTGVSPEVAILLGHGDGTFAPPVLIQTGLANGTTYGVVGDFNGDGKDDFAVFSANGSGYEVYLGKGDGTFDVFSGTGPAGVRAVVAHDFDGDGKDDLAVGTGPSGTVFVLLSKGDGTFAAPVGFATNTDPAGKSSAVIGLAVADMGNVNGNGNSVLGAKDGHDDLLVVTQPLVGGGLTQLNLLALKPGAVGTVTFGKATQLATGAFTGAVTAGTFAGNVNRNDIALIDGGNIRVIYNQDLTLTPNKTLAAARDLGSADHLVTQPMVIAPGFTDAYFKFTVPTEAGVNAKDQVIDLSASFSNLLAPGLKVEVLSADGSTVLGTGPRIQLTAAQGTTLIIHVSAAGAGGAGIYSLDLDVLPQVVSVAASSLLVDNSGQTAGAVNTLVITLQGDRLNAAQAQTASNYVVTLNGPGPLPGVPAIQSVVYDPGANPSVSQGRSFSTAVRQTITLVFSAPLPTGSYTIQLLPGIQTADYFAGEISTLANTVTFGSHAVAQVTKTNNVTTISQGATVSAPSLVTPPNQVGDLSLFNSKGTAFLTNFHDDMGAVLNSQLTQTGDASSVTQALLDQIVARFQAVAGPAGQPSLNFLVIVLDPVSIDLEAPDHTATTYNLQTAATTNAISRTFLEVGGNVEVMVLASVAGTYNMNIGNVPASARGAAAVFADGQVQTAALTDAIRGGQTQFQFVIPEAALAAGTPGGGTSTAGGGTTGGTTGSTAVNFTGGLPGSGAAGAQVAANLVGVIFDFSSSTSALLTTMFGGSGIDAPPSAGGDPSAANDNDNPNDDPQQQQRREDATRRGFGLGNTAGLGGQGAGGDIVQHGAGVSTSTVIGAGLGLDAPVNPPPQVPPVEQPPAIPVQEQVSDDAWQEVAAVADQDVPEAVAVPPVATAAAFAEPSAPAAETSRPTSLSPLVAAAVFTSGLYQQWWGKGESRDRKNARTPSRRPVKNVLLS